MLVKDRQNRSLHLLTELFGTGAMDNTNISELKAVLEKTQTIRDDLERKVFYYQTLIDTTRELAGLIQPKKIMDTFLLMAMGPFGITHGLSALINTKTREGHISCRGFSDSVVSRLKDNIFQICEEYFTNTDLQAVSIPRIKVITKDNIADHSLFPDRTRVLILWTIDEVYSGLLGFSGKFTGESLTEENIDILLSLTNILMNALSQALSTRNIRQLNSDLGNKNTELEKALNEARQAQDELDKRVFYLQTFYDLNSELSPIIEMDRLIDSFLLMTMGAFSLGKAFILLYDRDSKIVRTAVRGMDLKKEILPDVAERLFYESFEATDQRTLTPMSVMRIADTDILNKDPFGLSANSALMFLVDQTFMGLVGIGLKISNTPLSRDEDTLLFNYATNFIVYLKNTRSFEKIQALNKDLELRNAELNQTIAELTDAVNKITILEKAKAHIKSLVRGELQRMDRVKPFDFVLILATAILIGFFFNLSSPNGIPLIPESYFQPASETINVDQAQALLYQGKAIMIDARPKEFYNQNHIKSAINLPPAIFDFVYMMKLNNLNPDKEIIVYGRTISKHYDEEVASQLLQRGHKIVKVLEGGLSAWKKKGFSIDA